MERKNFTKAHIYVRDAYRRAGKLAAEGNYLEAIDVLVPVIRENPEIPALYEKAVYRAPS